MPIIISDLKTQTLAKRLTKAGAAVITENAAAHQDIRAARIGLLNLMPAAAMEVTEVQWLRYISHTILQIEPILIKFDDDPRERLGIKRKPILARYTPFSQAVEQGLDGLIITGDNLELRKDSAKGREALPFDEIHYANGLREIMTWANTHIPSTIFSCLASHFMLHERFGLPRTIGNHKVFGVYEHQVGHNIQSEFTDSMDDILRAPHSRWGMVQTRHLRDAGIDILAENHQAGWLLAQAKNQTGGYDLLMQGHPEYDRGDLHAEYDRDRSHGQNVPVGYYTSDNPEQTPLLTWANDARALHNNWIRAIYRSFSN
jgi:homoserine O-succinyltransferase/O-acetyltransferase